MSNTGHTTIEATGSPQDLAALTVHIRGTARDGCAFTLLGLMRPGPAPDHAVRWAELSATDEMVSLSIGITYDRDALGVAARIAERFPTLRIVAFFMTECDEAAFDALCFAGDTLAYQARFDDDICFPVPAPEPGGVAHPWCGSSSARPPAAQPPPTTSTLRSSPSSRTGRPWRAGGGMSSPTIRGSGSGGAPASRTGPARPWSPATVRSPC